ncbi:MAG: holo-ACP synthase [Gammaproteobacteria bacterium]|nr:holo-ACP synthase [Gammaproteobacteria bacterium]
MIFGIGTDIVSIQRLAANLERFGERLPNRLLGPEELADFQGAPDAAAFLARRFAAKEAALKALGTGLTQGLRLKDICVRRRRNQRPTLCFSGRAEALLQEYAIIAHHLSISDDAGCAIAFVVLEQAG